MRPHGQRATLSKGGKQLQKHLENTGWDSLTNDLIHDWHPHLGHISYQQIKPCIYFSSKEILNFCKVKIIIIIKLDYIGENESAWGTFENMNNYINANL